MSTAGSERIVSRASAPELEVRKSTHESELSDNKDESVSQEVCSMNHILCVRLSCVQLCTFLPD